MATKTEELLQKLVDNLGPLEYANLAPSHESAMATAAIAGLVVRPTTVAAITFWNGEDIGGKSLIVDRMFTHNLVSTAVKTFHGLWYCMHLETTKPTNDISTLRGKGDGSEPSNTVVTVDVGATVLNDGWFPAGEGGEVSETGITPQSISNWEVKGRLVVPPHHAISLHVVSSLVGDTFLSGLSWWRRQLPAAA